MPSKPHSKGLMEKVRSYACIDLKSFYAAVECVERGLDPMTTDLVVADETRTKGTICLAVSPSLKKKGIKNRCRLFQIPDALLKNTIIAPPRMKKYIDYSARIYGVYLNYFSKDDIYAYSIDEVFLDFTSYLKLYQKTPKEMVLFLMNEISARIGVRATAGVGTNLYLAKIALDILAKHSPDFVGELTEESYREQLWDHQPLTDFWRIGPGIAKKLAAHRMFTMEDIAKADEDVLYRVFGVDAELLIDHAWGRETVTLSDIKKYRPKNNNFSLGQVLPRNYNYEETALAVREMMRELCLRLVAEKSKATSVTLSLGGPYPSKTYLSGTAKMIGNETEIISQLYEKVADRRGLYRRIYLNLNKVEKTEAENTLKQSSLFPELYPDEQNAREHSKDIGKVMLEIQNKHGKSAIMTAEDLEDAGTTRWRSGLVGGHRSGK